MLICPTDANKVNLVFDSSFPNPLHYSLTAPRIVNYHTRRHFPQLLGRLSDATQQQSSINTILVKLALSLSLSLVEVSIDYNSFFAQVGRSFHSQMNRAHHLLSIQENDAPQLLMP